MTACGYAKAIFIYSSFQKTKSHIQSKTKGHTGQAPVSLKTLKSINIQHTNQRFWFWILTNWTINLIHQPEIKKLKGSCKKYKSLSFHQFCNEVVNDSIAQKLKAYQSNNFEYTIFAKASLLMAAASGSSNFVMVSPRVTITRLQSESSRAFMSHLENTKVQKRLHFFSLRII